MCQVHLVKNFSVCFSLSPFPLSYFPLLSCLAEHLTHLVHCDLNSRMVALARWSCCFHLEPEPALLLLLLTQPQVGEGRLEG